MISLFRPSLRVAKALFFGLALLCVLAQPVLAAGHELHEAEHERAASMAAEHGVALEVDSSEPGTLDGLLHVFDCCLHATAVPAPALDWIAQRLEALPPRECLPTHTPSQPSRFLRPPITA
ncbi:hypothetical protein [Arenimonas sp.]|uniref:hypothetical protein n=1 Tax=Arenimonas sp. TaxID=1872635 RepID=UPI0035AF5B03